MLVSFAAAAGSGRFTPIKPTLSYAGSGLTNMGKFTITNYNSTYTYTASGGTIASNVLTVTSATGSATLTAKSPKGLINSAGVIAYRQQPTQYYVQTGPFQCYYSPSCASQCGGCGTYYAQDRWNPNDGSPAGYYSCCDQGYWLYNSYVSTGYTWGGSNYTNGQGEWWKIS